MFLLFLFHNAHSELVSTTDRSQQLVGMMDIELKHIERTKARETIADL